MASSDLNVLLDMGFDRERAEIAVKQSGGLQGALQWLEDNQDKPIDDIRAADAEEEENKLAAAPLAEGEVAKSMVCNECGKKFRSVAQAEFHAARSEHTDFSESTEEIAPLTPEEVKARLEERKAKLAEKRAAQAKIDKAEQIKNEKIRMKSTKETQDAKEELQKKEQIKEAARKRQEKLDDIAAKKRIQEKIAADKEERRLKAERAKAEREGRAAPVPSPAPATSSISTSSTVNHTEARLRLQTPGGNIQKTFPADTTLFEVAQVLQAERGSAVESFTMNFPRKTFQGHLDFGKTLKEAGLVPSAVLIVKEA